MDTFASASRVNEMQQASSLIDGSLIYGRENDKNRIIQLLFSDDCNSRNATMQQASSLIDGSLIYGRENDKNRIIQLLFSDDCNSRNATFFCIVGPSGIGKTTVAQLIYTHKRVEGAFDSRIFIGMFEKNYDEKRLMKEMIEALTCNPCDINEPSILEDILKDELEGKKLLLVLDSAENEKRSFWNNLLLLLSVAAEGSAVLVTTNRGEVADITGAMHCFKLDHLSDLNCWLIFQQLAFNGHNNPYAMPVFVNTGRHLISKCECNILCIKLLGGLLSHLVTEEGWRSVLVMLESDLSEINISGREMLPVLRVCYDLLPSHLKRCFAYSALFPNGYNFSKNHLVSLWLSQGFIEPVAGRELEAIGLEYFEELCDRSFFHHSHLHDAKDDNFIMHEMIQDLSQYISRNKCFRSEDCVQIIPKNVSHFSLVPSKYQTVRLNLITEEAENLQSLVVINTFKFQQDINLSIVLNLEGLNDLFENCTTLRTLDLSNTYIEELPGSIKFLENLDYLGLSKTNIKCVPSEIGNLVNLQTFKAKGCHNLHELPPSIQALSNLRHFDVKKEAGFVSMPVGMGKLTSLHSLATFNVGSDETHCGIEELKHLENLKGSLEISGLENVKTSLDAKEASLKSKFLIENLCLNWSDNTVFIEDDGDTKLEENVLENLEPNENLQELTIRNYAGSKFPFWIGNPSFSKLASVILDNCPNSIMLPALGELPAVRYLSIRKMYGVDTMVVSKFPSLEILNLWEMYALVEWPEIGNGDFPCLRSLSISKCPLLKSIPCFPSLVKLVLHYCPQLLKIPELSSLESLKIEGLRRIKCLDLPRNLVALKKLEIGYCTELSSLEGLLELTSIEVLKVIQCPKLDVGDWRPNILKTDDTSVIVPGKVDFGEKPDAHDQDICITDKMRGKMADKRARDEQEEDLTIPKDKQVRRQLRSFSSVIRESVMQPIIRKLAKKEVERLLEVHRQPQMQTTLQEPFLYKLVVVNQPHSPIFTYRELEYTIGGALQILLVTSSSGSSSSLPSLIKIELVVLDGDFPSNDYWTSDEFNRAIVKERVGKRPLLVGDVNNVIMKDGFVMIRDLQFTDNSSWIRSQHFRIGVRVVPDSCVVGIKEAITEKFIIKDYRGEFYKKHYPPVLTDDVWRLEKITKDGLFHKKLSRNNINSVQDFLMLSTVDPGQLRMMLGSGMSDRMWQTTLNHARTCDLGDKTYLYSGQNVEIFLNSICQILRVTIGGIPYTLQNLPKSCRDDVQKLNLEAYKQWGKLKELDGEMLNIITSRIENDAAEQSGTMESRITDLDGVSIDFNEMP